MRTKAILVLNEIPSYCGECRFGQWNERTKHFYCDADEENIRRVKYLDAWLDEEEEKRPAWCPLKPMPEPKYAKATDTTLHWGECYGWNACLEEIAENANCSKEIEE